jgi:calcineurin-like phosphoesterase family protein
MDYIISDLHVNHKSIIGFSQRPFKSVNEMNEAIIDNWNSVITHNDRVFLLGDVMFSREFDEILKLLLKTLNGKIILILGNHDVPLEKLFKKNQYRVPDHKLFIIGHILDTKVDFGCNTFIKSVMCHYPLYSWNASMNGRPHFYGHVHNNTIKNDKVNHYNVSAEVLNYTPSKFSDVLTNPNCFVIV